MGKLRQSKTSGNDYWTDLVYQNSFSNPATAFHIPFDNLVSSTTYNLLPNQTYWVTWQMGEIVSPQEILSFIIWYPSILEGEYPFKFRLYAGNPLTTIPGGERGEGSGYIHNLPYTYFVTPLYSFVLGVNYYIAFSGPFYGECYMAITDTAIPPSPE